MEASPHPADQPAESAGHDGQIIQLPTMSGMLHDTLAAEDAASPELWAALAAAVMSERAFDDFEERFEDEQSLAAVIDLDAWRSDRP